MVPWRAKARYRPCILGSCIALCAVARVAAHPPTVPSLPLPHPRLSPPSRPPDSSSRWLPRISSAVPRTGLPLRLVACANGSGCILKGAGDGVAAGKASPRAPPAPTETIPPRSLVSSCPSLRLSPPPPCSCPPPPCGCSLPLPPAPHPPGPQSVSCWQWMQRSWSLALRWWTLHSPLPLSDRLSLQC